ncbi:MAG: hypothetical protein RLZZ117_1712 [Cyanobacteriota bacterium]
MTSGFQSHLDDHDLSRVSAALVRAGQRAREIARQTGTGIAVRIDGELLILRGEELDRQPVPSQEQADGG